MSNIQKTLKDLQPYLMGIRYLQGVPILEVNLKDGWFMPKVNKIEKAEVEGSQYHFLIYSNDENVEVDFLIEYLTSTINLNIEREIKLELLKTKINNLKELFKENTLTKLKTLKFTFGDTTIEDTEEVLDLNTIDFIPEELKREQPKHQPVVQPITQAVQQEIFQEPEIADIKYLDNQNNLSEEELEILEEEKRYQQFKKMKEANTTKPPKTRVKVELPPKKMLATNVDTYDETPCDCGPNEACSKCIDSK